MDEALKFIAAGGSITTLLLIYYVWQIEPRLRSMEKTQLQGQQVDLLKLAKDLSSAPGLGEKAQTLLKDTEEKLSKLK